MPRNAQGVYNRPFGTKPVAGDPILAELYNEALDDIANALTGSLPVNGSMAMTGDLEFTDGTTAVLGKDGTGNEALRFSQLPYSTAGRDLITAATAAAQRALLGIVRFQNVFDAVAEWNLLGDSGDAAKINAGQGDVGFWQTVVFPNNMTIPVHVPIVWTAASYSIEFNGTIFRPMFAGGAASVQDVFTVNIPSEIRCARFSGYRSYGVATGGTGGRHAFAIQGAALECTIEDFIVYAGENPAGYDLFISGTGDPAVPHWNTLRNSAFGLRGIGHYGADGWLFEQLVGFGSRLLTLMTVPGAFRSSIRQCTTSCTDASIYIGRGSQTSIEDCSFEHSSLNIGPYSASIVIIPQFSGTNGVIADVRIKKTNFGGGPNVFRSIFMASGASKIVGVFIDENCFNETFTNFDVVIANAECWQTRIGTQNTERRAGSGPTDPGFEVRVSDAGSETIGVWKTFGGGAGQIPLAGTWTADAQARVRVCPYTRRIEGEGNLIPGAMGIGAQIVTMPLGMRPRGQFYRSVMTNNGSGVREVVVQDSGLVSVGNIAFAGTRLALADVFNHPVISTPTYIQRA